jgi:hypothetical protein
MSDPAYDTIRFLKDQIDKPPQDSKKWKLITRGMIGILFIFILSASLLFIKPELAGNITSLAQVVATAWSGLLVIGIGAIAAVDYKNTGSLANVIQTVTDKPEVTP